MTDRKSPLTVDDLRAQFFPFTTPQGFVIKAVAEPELRKFVSARFAEVFRDKDLRPRFVLSPERRAGLQPVFELYRKLHHEFFLFYAPTGETVGWHMGEADDALTFYMRNTGVLEEFRNRGLYRAFAERFVEYLAAVGYERISSQHMGTNRAILITKLKMGFDIAGLELSEIWGPLVKLVKILPTDRRRSFYEQFGALEHL